MSPVVLQKEPGVVLFSCLSGWLQTNPLPHPWLAPPPLTTCYRNEFLSSVPQPGLTLSAHQELSTAEVPNQELIFQRLLRVSAERGHNNSYLLKGISVMSLSPPFQALQGSVITSRNGSFLQTRGGAGVPGCCDDAQSAKTQQVSNVNLQFLKNLKRTQIHCASPPLIQNWQELFSSGFNNHQHQH